MFCEAAFNGDISKWDVSKVTECPLCSQATAFNAGCVGTLGRPDTYLLNRSDFFWRIGGMSRSPICMCIAFSASLMEIFTVLSSPTWLHVHHSEASMLIFQGCCSSLDGDNVLAVETVQSGLGQ
jgi:hypothetical protein